MSSSYRSIKLQLTLRFVIKTTKWLPLSFLESVLIIFIGTNRSRKLSIDSCRNTMLCSLVYLVAFVLISYSAVNMNCHLGQNHRTRTLYYIQFSPGCLASCGKEWGANIGLQIRRNDSLPCPITGTGMCLTQFCLNFVPLQVGTPTVRLAFSQHESLACSYSESHTFNVRSVYLDLAAVSTAYTVARSNFLGSLPRRFSAQI